MCLQGSHYKSLKLAHLLVRGAQIGTPRVQPNAFSNEYMFAFWMPVLSTHFILLAFAHTSGLNHTSAAMRGQL